MRASRVGGEHGFTLVELVFVMLAIVALASISVPRFNNLIRAQKARDAARMVERELQTARLKAVSTSRALRVRFDCPAAGQFRTLEVTGVSAVDNAANRCSPVAFPSPGPNDALRSTPSLDGPVRYLPTSTTLASSALNFEFSPKGQVFTVSSGNVVAAVAGNLVMTVTRQGWSNTVTLNELGRIRLN